MTSLTIRFQADNAGAWFFHRHSYGMNAEAGLSATFIEASEVFSVSGKPDPFHIQQCIAQGILEVALLQDVKGMGQYGQRCLSWPLAREDQDEIWRQFDRALIEITRHASTATMAKQMFKPVVMTGADDEKMFRFVFPTSAHLLEDGPKAFKIEALTRPEEQAVEDLQLEVALNAHHYGAMADDYSLAEDSGSL
ncbi:hypothetical protein DFQ26_007971 [Actinomortierella ambigua]|nr:hypothetical protein DFQ26_007971 [Actinomortierella ambigua]